MVTDRFPPDGRFPHFGFPRLAGRARGALVRGVLRAAARSTVVVLVLLRAGPLWSTEPGAGAREAPAQALHSLLDEEWEWRLAQFPETATSLGDHRYDDRLTDLSAPAAAARRAHHVQFLAALRALDAARLEGEDRISLEVFLFGSELAVREDALLLEVAGSDEVPWAAGDGPLGVNQMSGPQFALPQLARASRFADEADYRHYLARWAALPAYLRQWRAILDAGREAHWQPPRVAMERLPGQFAAVASGDPERNPLFEPFRRMPAAIAEPVRAALRAEGEKALRETVAPAFTAFRDYIAATWLPAAPPAVSVTALAHGSEYYEIALQRLNTTHMSPREIHDLGLREVARIDREMLGVMRESGFGGSLAEFRTYLRTDPKFQFRTGEEELVALRDIAKRVDPLLPRLFAELPRLPYGIRAMTPEEGNNAPHYIAGALDGSRAGYFEANVNNLAAWPTWTMEALFLHEAMPGHHLQISRAREIPSLPRLRRSYGNSGYAEGWGLYSEGLGRELDLYADPYSRFGRLAMDAQRACRLVVDTGLHGMGWTREQAIEYLIDHAQLERGFAEAEVDRYIVWPGQATAYKVGEQRILALREKARAALGARFDIRRFHNALLDHGALPLAVLDRVIGDWIETEKARAAN
jgi:uncharacterized protein (DUF885 family)